MYGAILGDIIGSPFEFGRGNKTKEFELFTKGCGYTDDTVLSIAVAEAMMACSPEDDPEEIDALLIKSMRKWGNKYPYAGYGGKFDSWLTTWNPQPYNSYGNGSAMRVSSIGWMYDDLETTRKMARHSAEVTHNHPEGIKGAEATASCIFLARTGATKDEIRAYTEENFGYDLHRKLEDIRPAYHHVESCQESVPESILSFLEGKDFEDSVRNAVSLGGDADTLGAITGSIAEAFYGVPEELKEECRNRIPTDMLGILMKFAQMYLK